MLAALAGNLIQHRLVWSAEALTPKLSKISPAAGFKRLFSKQALANFAKGLVKLVLVGAVHHRADVAGARPARRPGAHRSGRACCRSRKSLSLKMLGTVVAILAIVAAADYLFQYRQWYERQKMSLRELKEEFKQTEGDPAIKGKMRQMRQTRMRKRMMAAVPKASVVITNPTHYAIALQYERGMNAPICVAKGVDAHRPEDPRGRRRALDPDRREPAARPRAACHRRDRPGDPARALQGGGRGHRLRHAAAPGGRR